MPLNRYDIQPLLPLGGPAVSPKSLYQSSAQRVLRDAIMQSQKLKDLESTNSLLVTDKLQREVK